MPKGSGRRSQTPRSTTAPRRRRIRPLTIAVLSVVVAGLVASAIYVARAKPPALAAALPSTKAPAFLSTVPNRAAAPGASPDNMVWIPGGEFSMGAADPMGADNNDVGMHATTDSRPIHRVYVDGFWMDATEVTNAQFAAFVKATGYVTVAERTPRAQDFPGAPPENLVAGAVVFTNPGHPVPLDNHFQW